MAEGQGVDRAQQDAGQEQAAAEPSPENVLSGLQVQEKNLRELRRTLFTRLFQLQVSFSVIIFSRAQDGGGGWRGSLSSGGHPSWVARFYSLIVGALSLVFPWHAHAQAEEAVLRAKLPEELQQQYPPGVEALTGEEGTGTRTAASK